MEKENKLCIYESPSVEIIEVEVEKGFAQSSGGTTESIGNAGSFPMGG